MQRQTVYKHIDAAIVKSDGNVIRGIASQERIDRDNDVILIDGIETGDYLRNPVLLANHDRTFDLGVVTKLWRENRPEGRCLMVEASLLEPASDRQREVIGAIKAGARRGISIGFIPLEADRQPVREGQRGYTYRRVSLLEMSAVSLPSCASCLIEQRAWRDRDEIVLELTDDPTPASCGCGSRRHEIVLELLDHPPADPRARHHRHLGGETFDTSPAQVLGIMRDVINEQLHPAAIGRIVRETTERVLAAARGRVD